MLKILKEKVNDDWKVAGRKRLATLTDVSNIVFKKTKNKPGLGIPKNEVSEKITEKLRAGVDVNNYSPCRNTIDRFA